MDTVCVLIVTYNRAPLLKELISSLLKQTHSISRIILIDNLSTDGTLEMLQELEAVKNYAEDEISECKWNNIWITYYRSSFNMGGSGGFSKAFEIVQQYTYDYVWVMDDDVEPDDNCLEMLLKAMSDDVRVCVPMRYAEGWKDKAIIGYNLTNPFLYKVELCKKVIPPEQIEGDGVFVCDMPFEGPLLNMQIVKSVGIPNKDFFIMFDDTEYAHRLSRITHILYVKKAKLKRKNVVQFPDGERWSWKTFYLLRNQFYFDRHYGKNLFVRYLRPIFSLTVKICSELLRGEKRKIKWIIKAYLDAKKERMGKTLLPGTKV